VTCQHVSVGEALRTAYDLPARFIVASIMQCSDAMSFGIYLLGIILVISGLVYGAAMLHAPAHWLIVGTLVMLGAGVVAAVKATRQRDPAE
jgi:uncharacterized membrane protein YecN with MAPEG domain